MDRTYGERRGWRGAACRRASPNGRSADPGARGSAKLVDAEPRRAYEVKRWAGEKKEIDVGDRTIERLKLVLGADGWKAFMAELAAARGH